MNENELGLKIQRFEAFNRGFERTLPIIIRIITEVKKQLSEKVEMVRCWKL